jgi:hypothetical protein
MSAGALLLPLLAAADSQVQTGARNAALSATAHINFKIIIPPVLSLRMGAEFHAGAGAQNVAIMSNYRTVSLNATIRSSDDDVAIAHGNVILNAAARKIIAQDALCASQPGSAAAAATADDTVKVDTQVVCTASMP